MEKILIGSGLIYGITTIVVMTIGGINFPLLLILAICIAIIDVGIYLYKKDKRVVKKQGL
ncbi:MAG: hypothetical protein KKH52_03925 [Nanoarchaeota archaeon]|nr:hypothetical protein [Nanoarchaeota archaeon]MBU1622956.1 hypothetical protein [Nanoarchaeota archaeon]MBU1974517.1 hypothetical protein [Nanoarchaeota archaeon]